MHYVSLETQSYFLMVLHDAELHYLKKQSAEYIVTKAGSSEHFKIGMESLGEKYIGLILQTRTRPNP